jgi:hypothetical protein
MGSLAMADENQRNVRSFAKWQKCCVAILKDGLKRHQPMA